MTKSQLNFSNEYFIIYADALKNINKIKSLTFNESTLGYTSLYDLNTHYAHIFKEFMK